MKKLVLSLALVLLALGAPAFACSGDAKAADTAAATDRPACCAAHEKTAATCPHAMKAVAGTEKSAACPHAMKAADTTVASASPDCPMAKHAEAAASHECTEACAAHPKSAGAVHECPHARAAREANTAEAASPTTPSDTETTLAMAAETDRAAQGRPVNLTGKLLCEHCDLKRTETCHSVFQVEGQDELIPVTDDSDVTALRKACDHGRKTVKVKGEMIESAEGSPELRIVAWSDASV